MSPGCSATGPARSGLTSPLQRAWPAPQSYTALRRIFLTSSSEASVPLSGRQPPAWSSNTVTWVSEPTAAWMFSVYFQRPAPWRSSVMRPLPDMPM